jgi:hypothetical protein
MAADVEDGKMAAQRAEKKKNTQRIRVMIFLSVCYSANTGGSGTLTGKLCVLNSLSVSFCISCDCPTLATLNSMICSSIDRILNFNNTVS